MALPQFEPQFDEDFRNLAGFQEAADVMAPPLAPTAPRALYRAWDGTPIGYNSDCDPLTAEPDLSGLLVPDILADNRITWGEQFALPLAAGAGAYLRDAPVWQVVAWTLAAYVAPYPAAIALVGPGLVAALRR